MGREKGAVAGWCFGACAIVLLALCLGMTAGCGNRGSGPSSLNVIVESKVFANKDQVLKDFPRDFRQGWEQGFDSGFREGYDDFTQGNGYDSSLKGIKGQTRDYRSGYKVGNMTGYDQGFKASRDEFLKNGSAVTTDYHEGYMSGREAGARQGEKDSYLGGTRTRNDYPEGTVHPSGDKEYKDGWYEGYNDGYLLGRNLDYYEKGGTTAASGGNTASGGQGSDYYQQGYDDGYAIGKKDAGRDARENPRKYTPDPSVEMVDSYTYGHNGAGYRAGWALGYYAGYTDAWYPAAGMPNPLKQ